MKQPPDLAGPICPFSSGNQFLIIIAASKLVGGEKTNSYFSFAQGDVVRKTVTHSLMICRSVNC